jgi:hypothetical protein
MFYIFLNKANFQDNSNEMILSWQGSFMGGILFLVLSSLVVYYTKNPNEKRNEHFYNLTQGLTVFVAIFCLIGIKTFGILEVDFQNKGFSYKKYCAPLGLTERRLLRCYRYLAPLVPLGNCTRGAKYW